MPPPRRRPVPVYPVGVQRDPAQPYMDPALSRDARVRAREAHDREREKRLMLDLKEPPRQTKQRAIRFLRGEP